MQLYLMKLISMMSMTWINGDRFNVKVKEPVVVEIWEEDEGLADSFRNAFKNADTTPVNTIYSSLNGENFGVKEYGVACIRNNSLIAPEVKHEHPADCFGDIGAAFAPVLIGLIAKSEVKNQPHIAYCSSESGYRGAVYIQN